MKAFFKKYFGWLIPGGGSSSPASPKDPTLQAQKEKDVDAIIADYMPVCVNLLAFNPSLSFWQSVFKGMITSESSWDRYSTYYEEKLADKNGNDKATGMRYLSEGYLQLSYSDTIYYPFACHFDIAADKAKKEKDPSKTIFDIRKNIECGMYILDQLVKVKGTYLFNAGHYWAVLKPENRRHSEFLAAFNKYQAAVVATTPVVETPVITPAPVEVKPTPVVVNPAPTTLPMKSPADPFVIRKVAIIIGHGDAGDYGATNWNKETEFAYQSKVAKLVQQKVEGKQVELFWRKGLGIAGVAKKAMDWRPDITVELHNNSFNGTAKGIEVLVLKKDKVSLTCGQDFAKKYVAKFGSVLRDGDGVKELEGSERGAFSLKQVNDPPPSILLEPFFGDNPNDWKDAETYSTFVADWINGI